jgi:cytochrome c-type biogenesis protein CcmH/NrfG
MSAASQLQKAVAREQSGDLAGAMAGYQKVLRHEPSNIDALFLLGRAQLQQGQFEASAKALRSRSGRSTRRRNCCSAWR